MFEGDSCYDQIDEMDARSIDELERLAGPRLNRIFSKKGQKNPYHFECNIDESLDDEKTAWWKQGTNWFFGNFIDVKIHACKCEIFIKDWCSNFLCRLSFWSFKHLLNYFLLGFDFCYKFLLTILRHFSKGYFYV